MRRLATILVLALGLVPVGAQASLAAGPHLGGTIEGPADRGPSLSDRLGVRVLLGVGYHCRREDAS
jgi:hypothetical protein